MNKLAMIVENDPDSASLFSHVLDFVGFETKVILNGKQALTSLSEVVPVLVLLDLQLSHDVSGEDILRYIRGDKRFSGTHVIVITGYPNLAGSVENLADLILITHEHGDHLDADAIKTIRKEDTQIVLTKYCTSQVTGGIEMQNGDVETVQGLKIEAVPAYNIVHMRSAGNPFHPKGRGNGYVITFGDKRVYVAGDTENTPEMKRLRNIDIAFLPMNLPYTMTPEMVADAAKVFKPKILYPYHYGRTNPKKLTDLLKDSKDIEVRIRDMR